MQGHYRFDKPRAAGGGFAVADVGFEAADAANDFARSLLQQAAQGGYFHLVAEARASAMAFDESDRLRRVAGTFVGPAQCP